VIEVAICEDETAEEYPDVAILRFAGSLSYLKIALDEETYNKYIPADVSENSKDADGRLFGKPVWDFKYPESSFFITENKFMVCSISLTRPGDVVYVACGSTYPLVLRPG
jgi:hypothetical protein